MDNAARRHTLLRMLVASLPIAACAGVPTADAVRPIEIAPGVYMAPGTGGAADESNRGRIGNSGFIVGERGVIGIDTGTSYAHGRELLAGIRAITDKPVRVALITHTRPEFLFGGTAFREAHIPIRISRFIGRRQ